MPIHALMSCSARVLLAAAVLSSPAVRATAQPTPRQDVVQGAGILITEGLVIPGWDYYRSGWQADPLEIAAVTGTWKPPSAGERIDSSHVWQPVKADSGGWLAHPDLRGGYLYATVTTEQGGIMLLEGLGHRQVLVNGEPRTGNVYGFKEDWEAWEPPFDYSFVPVKLLPGSNDLLFFGGRAPRIKARFHPAPSPIVLNPRDLTLPDLIVGEDLDAPASIALINATETTLRGYALRVAAGDAPPTDMAVPDLPPLSVRKVAFRLVHPAPLRKGQVAARLAVVDTEGIELGGAASISLNVRDPGENHRRTFVSSIDGSVQYYGLNPARDDAAPQALVLSVHGAAVEAINQSGSYRSKPWAHIVSPTNRRPYGFNWEDWGRLDALEVLDIARSILKVDPRRVYLTGHSMGGHGTWHLGALYPDRFAAIGPSAGWISFWSYRPRGEVESTSPVQEMLMRATLPSRTMDLAPNYAALGVYVIHGADDDNVPAEQSRMMVERLSTFHRDFVYHEEPDAGHWWDKSDEPGADCVDWPPLFDFFARHALPAREEIRRIDFITPNPGVSSCYLWACILAQQQPLRISRISLQFDPGVARFSGVTENVERLVLTVPEPTSDSLQIVLDGQRLRAFPDEGTIRLQRTRGAWRPSGQAAPSMKGPHRNGTFKDAFRNRVVLVYGTEGTAEENEWALAKARFDAEQFWYQGNGGIDVVPDSRFSSDEFVDRNVVLYGNEDTNGAWAALLADSPVRVTRGRLEVGGRSYAGTDFGVLLIRPRPGSDVASVAAVAGSGLPGMRVTDLRPYLSAGFAYPDLAVFRVAADGEGGDVAFGAGFFGNDWSVERGEFAWARE